MRKPTGLRQGRLHEILRQVLAFGHAQIGDGDEVGGCSKAFGSPLGLLQKSVHGIHVGVAAVVEHAAHDCAGMLFEGVGPLFERIQQATLGPTNPNTLILKALLLFRIRLSISTRNDEGPH